LLNIDNSQIRKDLKYLDKPGKARLGYDAKILKKAIEEKLGFKQTKDAFIIGAGNLGSALAKYSSFQDYGLNVLAMFDNNPNVIGTTINGKEVFDITRVGNLSQRLGVDIAILTVPRESAKSVANYLAGSGIKYIWNFTTCILDVPKDVKVWNENLVGSFLQFTNNNEVKEDKND
jgi:redox-sensing transcriptional repressor